MRRMIVALVATAMALVGFTGPAGAGQHAETADVLDQGSGPVLVEDGARLIRTPNGLSIQLAMPTPASGTYQYPTAGAAFAGPGHPEAFSLWAFVFNFPDMCDGPCDAGDLGNTPAQGGAFFVTGHLVGGSQLVLSGHVTRRSTPFIDGHPPLQNPSGAEIHLAVAPHGGLDPSLLPELIKTPTQPNTAWWTAIFD